MRSEVGKPQGVSLQVVVRPPSAAASPQAAVPNLAVTLVVTAAQPPAPSLTLAVTRAATLEKNKIVESAQKNIKKL